MNAIRIHAMVLINFLELLKRPPFQPLLQEPPKGKTFSLEIHRHKGKGLTALAPTFKTWAKQIFCTPKSSLSCLSMPSDPRMG